MKKLKLRYVVQIFHPETNEWADSIWTNHIIGRDVEPESNAMAVTKSLARKALKLARYRWPNECYLITLASVS